MEIEAVLSFSRRQLYVMQESVPDSETELLDKISEALARVERSIPVYGNGVTIKPKEEVSNETS